MFSINSKKDNKNWKMYIQNIFSFSLDMLIFSLSHFSKMQNRFIFFFYQQTREWSLAWTTKNINNHHWQKSQLLEAHLIHLIIVHRFTIKIFFSFFILCVISYCHTAVSSKPSNSTGCRVVLADLFEEENRGMSFWEK